MIEQHVRGATLGMERFATADDLGNTRRLLIVDGQVNEAGELVPGTGSGLQQWVYMDDRAAAMLHEATADANPSAVVVPKPKLIVPT